MTSNPCGRLSSKPTARTSTYEESSPDGEPAPCATPPTSDRSQQRRDLHERDYSGNEPAITAGVGKTQLAIEYAYRSAADYDLIWWIDAEQPALIAAQLGALADPLHLPPGRTVADTVGIVLD